MVPVRQVVTFFLPDSFCRLMRLSKPEAGIRNRRTLLHFFFLVDVIRFRKRGEEEREDVAADGVNSLSSIFLN